MSVALNDHIDRLLRDTKCDATAEILGQITTLFDVLKHGEKGHQDWLQKAIECHFLNRPLPEYVAK